MESKYTRVIGQMSNVFLFISIFLYEKFGFIRTLFNSITLRINKNIFINDILLSSVLALAKLAETRDEVTGEHMERMQEYSRTIAELLYENNTYSERITPKFIDQIYQFSPLHDIGKVGIRDGILLKPGKLTNQEFAEMQKHTSYGATVLRSAELNMQKYNRSLFKVGIEIAECHHEKWDGSGYPEGRKEEQIPLSARIVAIADVFDALTSTRPYKDAYSLAVSFDVIKEGRGKHFDPLIVDVFLSNRKKIEEVYHKFRSNQLAIVRDEEIA
jgi:response regulator RpfG family c-di-GMP phosphodiesterase